MNNEDLIYAIKDQNFWGKEQDTGILRCRYLKEISRRSKLKESLVLMGVRRSGKSTLTKQFILSCINKGVDKRDTLYINFENPSFASSLNLKLIGKVYNSYTEIVSGTPKIIVLDEVQNIPGWEKWVRKMQEDEPKMKIIVTGSSSKLLSSEFSTVMAGRSTGLEIFPLSFKEFLKFKGVDIKDKQSILINRGKIRSLLREYMEFGGFPRVALEEKKNKKILLREYYESIVLRDAAARYNIRDIGLLKALTTILLTSVSSKVSIKKLADSLQESFKHKISLETVSRFLEYLESAYLIFALPIFSYKIKEQARYPRKVYAIDCGLRNAASFRFSEDKGRLAENAVFLELRRKGKELYYWKSDKGKEVDFVIKEGIKIKNLINVCWEVNEKNKSREVSSMLDSMNEFKLKEGTIITYDYKNVESIKGKKIRYTPLYDWLLFSQTS